MYVRQGLSQTFHSPSPAEGRFGRVIDGDLRVTEFGSWLQATKADYYP